MTTVKWGRPARNSLHLVMAHDTTRSSNSMMAYQDSVSQRNLEPAWIRAHSFFVLSSGCKGVNRWARVVVLAESWLARPQNVRRSVLLAGVGKLEIVSVMDLSTL